MIDKVRFPAEWEEQDAILLTLPSPETDWDYMLPEITDEYKGIVEKLSKSGELIIILCRDCDAARNLLQDTGHDESILYVRIEYNDTWVRDYGPLCVENQSGSRFALDFGFNGWGLKFASDKDNLVNLNLADMKLIPAGVYINNRDFELEGGSVESDGRGTILTTTRCLCSPNRNGGRSKAEIQDILSERLGADHFLWLDYGALEGDDTDSHVDTLARLCPDNTILFCGCRDVDDSHFEELLKMRAQLTLFRTRDGEPYNLVELPLPDAVYDEERNRLPATYCNYLVTNRHVFVPQYGNPQKDELARMLVQVAYPSREAVGVSCVNLIRQHGSLHCATMQLPCGIISENIKNLYK